MSNNQSPNLGQYVLDWAEDIEILRQNWLLSESSFLTFARDRGIAVAGVVTGEPGEFHKNGWLPADDKDEDGGLRFHPFRLYAVHETLRTLAWKRTLESLRECAAAHSADPIPAMRTGEIAEIAATANEVVDLAVLLEPIYWPEIIGTQRVNAYRLHLDPAALFLDYRLKALGLVRSLNVTAWQKIHEQLRIGAGQMDNNPDLYVLLRFASWRERERLKGKVSGALWIRHIAEVIRRGFEEAHAIQWLEEDRAFGIWYTGARERIYGAERPLDDPLRCKPYVAFNFGLFTGSAVRWYVEGPTEYCAIEALLGQPSKIGVELVDLKGSIAAERDNAALKLEEWLEEDRKFRRFSAISFDSDVAVNVKVIRRQVEKGNIVGSISAHDPDFEFANFQLDELVEIAAALADAQNALGDDVRNADWTGITSAKAFATQYNRLLAKTLKGEAWGQALAEYARRKPVRSDTGRERRIMLDVAAAFRGRYASYDFQLEHFTFDPATFEAIPRSPSGDGGS